MSEQNMAKLAAARLTNARADAKKLIDLLGLLNLDSSPARSRALSLAITNMEQALHWLEHAPVRMPDVVLGEG